MGETVKQDRMAWMDQLRGAAIVLVILYHAETVAARFAPDIPAGLVATLEFFAPFRMPVLMFLSGMLLSRSLAKPTKTFFAGKLRGIAWPYVIWSFIFLAVSAQLTAQNMLAVAVKPPTYLWYLWFLLAYYAFAWLMDRWNIPMWIGAAAGFIGAFGPDTFRFSRFCFLFVFFVAGHLYAARGQRVLLDRKWIVPLTLVALIGFGIMSVSGTDVQYNPVFILAPFAAIALCVSAMPEARLGRAGGALAYIGRDSIVFYVTHFTVIWAVAWGLQQAGMTSHWIMYSIAVVFAVSAGLALTWARHHSRLADGLFQLPTRPAKTAELIGANRGQ